MRVISVLNLKGGCSKTVTSINMAYTLATLHNYKVLLIDNDKQGNTSKFFKLHSEDRLGVQDILVYDELEAKENDKMYPRDVIFQTEYKNIDIITTNMNLLIAEKEVLMDSTNPQQTRLCDFLEPIRDFYDFCIIDNAPDLGMAVTNALVFSDDVIVPIKIDQFSFDGLSQIDKHVTRMKKKFNPRLELRGCFVTQYTNTIINNDGNNWLNENYPMFKTKIRRTVTVDESTFCRKPLLELAKDCTAAIDYVDFVNEYLEGVINGEKI